MQEDVPLRATDAAFPRRQRRALVVLAVAELLAMSLWFSGSAVVPELEAAWSLDPGVAAWMTMAVQLGFVAGAVLSAVLTISDVWSPRVLFAGSAVAGAAATAAIAAFSRGPETAIPLRFLTGVALAGVYPPGMKLMAGWFRERRGMAIGVLVGALTVGSAAPHLLRAAGGIGSWRPVLYLAAGLATLGALLVLAVDEGPHQAPSAPFDPGAVGRILRDRATMLANGGYFGHMWELYAMWTWIPLYLTASYEADAAAWSGPRVAAVAAFGTIAVGGIGAWWAGVAADRIGRTRITSASMTASGACCLAAGLLFGADPRLVTLFCLLWGLVIVADSAQFSACVTELAEESYVGTALTLQTAVGFLLTLATIRLVPVWREWWGWSGAFVPLFVGPLLGTLAMRRLAGRPEARELAGGRG